jgi:enoyl-CoA hydratase/carnithine racemase
MRETTDDEQEPLGIERRAGALIITIRREARMNALDRRTVAEFGRVYREELRASDRAVIVTGQGERAFCAGADLKERRTLTLDQVREQLRAYRSDLGWLSRSPVPTVAAINGVALGGGLELCLLCDLRVAAPHVELGLPETSLGIIPAAGGTQYLPRLIGLAKAKELVLLGRRVTATQALSIGLVHRVCDVGSSVLDDTLSWIEPITQGAPIAQRAALKALDGAQELDLSQGLELELACYEECLQSEDRLEALQAFAEKRKPAFKGR